MATLAQLTNAPSPMKISDEEFSATTLRDIDYAELDEYIQTKLIDIARRQLVDSADEKSELLQAAIKAAACSGWSTQEGWKIICTPEGTARLGWQMIKRMHKTLTFAKFKEVFFLRKGTDSDQEYKTRVYSNIQEVNIVFNRLNGLDETDAPSSEGGADSPKS